MANYEVEVYSEMGHLIIHPTDGLPSHITNCIFNKNLQYLTSATDLQGKGCVFHVLKEGFKDTWTYKVKDDTLTIKWRVYTFQKDSMK
jgi:hypothetical protein